MKCTVSFFDARTGLFTGRRMTGSVGIVNASTPKGCRAIAGEHNPRNRRVNLDTGQVEPFKPDAPSDVHVWNETTELWELPEDAVMSNLAAQMAQHHISKIEGGSMRAMREALIAALPSDHPARKRLERVESDIEKHRPLVRGRVVA